MSTRRSARFFPLTLAALAALASLASLAGCAAEAGPLLRDGDDQAPPPKTTKRADVEATPPAPPPPPAARNTGVVFLHGTADEGNVADYACTGVGEDFHCEVKLAVDEYWQRATIDSERTREDGTRRPFAVLGCPLASQTPWPNPTPVKGTGPEPGSAVCAAAETARFLDGPDGKSGTPDDITDIVLVTHSGGSNVVRYMLQQHASRTELGRIHAASRGFIGLAAPTTGTYLADWVFQSGTLPNILNTVLAFFGGAGLFDDDGTYFIRTSAMAASNRDPAKLVDVAKDVAGVPSFMGAGTIPTTSGDPAKVACGGESETKGLGLLHTLYLSTTDAPTSRDGCSDGFVSCPSSMALAGGDITRVLFGRVDGRDVGQTTFRAHNQSRLSCDGTDLDVRRQVNAIFAKGASKPTSFGIGATRARLPFEPAFVAALADSRPVSPIRAAHATSSVDAVLVEVEVDVREAANLGVRATLVATGESGAELVVSSEQVAAQSRPGAKVFTLRLPTGAMAPGERLRVRDVALIRHDDARTLALVPRLDITP